MTKTHIKQSIASGFLVGIGCMCYASIENHYIGAFLFSIALCSICLLTIPLFTGRIYLVTTKRNQHLISMLMFNLFGALIAKMIGTLGGIDFYAIGQTKLLKNPLEFFFMAVICGILMTLAVEGFKRSKSLSIVVMCIMGFILCGGEHCIANMVYFNFPPTIKSLTYLIINIIGNALGSIGIWYLLRRTTNDSKILSR